MKRKTYSKEFKDQILKEVEETGNQSLVARRHDISQTMVSRWVREARKDVGEDILINNSANSKELERENDQLKKLLGEKDLEIAILRDLIKKKNPHLLKKLK